MSDDKDPDELLHPDVSDNEEEPRVEMRVEMSRSFAGPLPPPDLYRQYEEVAPGTAREIVEMAKSRQSHEQDMERHAVAIVTDHLPRRERTLRWAMLLIGFVATLAIAAFCFTVYWDAASWEPYGVGGFIASWPIALTIYRLLVRKRD